jgi:hypothetical protein
MESARELLEKQIYEDGEKQAAKLLGEAPKGLAVCWVGFSV